MRKIAFVKQSAPDVADEKPKQGQATPQQDWGDLYDRIAFPHGKPEVRETVNADHAPESAKCPTCGGELPLDDAGRRVHTSSIVHQLALGASSRAPAAIDRKSKGLKMMEKYGYDPDERKGLGVEGEGLKKPIEVKERKRGAALGSKDEYAKKQPKPEDASKVMKKTKGEKKASRQDDLTIESRKHKMWYNELFGR